MTFDPDPLGADSVHFSHSLRLEPGTPPRLPRAYVPRDFLWQQLDRASESAVTVLVAPGGSGKTLGVAGWVRRRFGTVEDSGVAEDSRAPSQVIWIDGGLSWGPQRLAAVIDRGLAGLRQTEGADEISTVAMRSATRSDQPPTLVVIDEAQKLPSAGVRLIEDRLNRDPGSLRIMLLSRWDLLQTSLVPELMGDLTILRGDALRLNDDEATSLISQHAGTSDAEVARAIIGRADGWCAAVVLAARAVRTMPDPLEAAHQFARGDARFADRAASEVLSSLSTRQRHLLLCVAGERLVSGETACHLSRDQRAGELMADLAADGLLVTRVSRPAGTAASSDDALDNAWYRIHPLLAEVVRRRLAVGGVDVEQARGTVARAVSLDLARDITDRAFERLVLINRIEQAAELLAADGVSMVACGQGRAIARFVRRHPELVDVDPRTWFPIALERWAAGDVDAARHWLDRIIAEASDRAGVVETASARLMRARLGLESMQQAVAAGQQLVSWIEPGAERNDVARTASLAVLLIELGATQNWLGDLDRAELNLTAAIGLCRTSSRLFPLTAAAKSMLALTHYMLGREHTCGELAAEINADHPYQPDEVSSTRAALAVRLARSADVAWLRDPVDGEPPLGRQHPADLCALFWARIYESRIRASATSLTAAEELLAQPLPLPVADELPLHLRAVTLIERGCLACLAGDGDWLRQGESKLRGLGLDGEAALMSGFRADLAGDRRAAVDAFETCVDSASGTRNTRAIAMVCSAQLLDELGESERAFEWLRRAATETAVRRNALPFMGWCRQGTPMQDLLAALRQRTSLPWVDELADALAGLPDLTVRTASRTATPRERASATEVPVRPTLSARERDVLRELARGATYADIGAELFVSENTVKTHVSNLYGKLGASRRSEALSIARGLHLL
ncbi:helix-turn-helix transcriptional regulator [Microlunatus elymi]|nr:LuxR C-terminal-related transcriptional regulator [Microlunatus elymi]